MAYVFKKDWTEPLLARAELYTLKGVRMARWRIRNGEQRTGEVITGKSGALRVRGQSAVYYARYKNGQGVWVEKSTGCTDKTAAEAVLAEWVKRSELVRAGIISQDQDDASKHGSTPIEPHVAAWRDHLKLKGCSPHWYTQAERRVLRVLRDQKIRRLRDFTAAKVEAWLADRADEDMSAGTRNGYRMVSITFCNWCKRNKRLTTNPLLEVPAANPRVDVRRQRRALTEDELARLLHAAQDRPLADAMTVRRGEDKGKQAAALTPENRDRLNRLGWERALIYKTLVLTGLRKGELASITVAQTDLTAPKPYLILNARDEKNRQGSDIAVPQSLAQDLRDWLADRLARAQRAAHEVGNPIPMALSPTARLFDVPAGLIRIFDRDLVYAGLARTEKRGGREVIVKTDDRGRTIDVHALRHTFGTQLSKAGVSLQTAQVAMRHSDPSLTANVYTDPRLLDVDGAVELLPKLPLGKGTVNARIHA